MARRVSITFKENGVDLINQSGRVRLGRVQRFDVNANLPNTVINELGSNKQVGRIFDLAEVTATISSIDVGARTVFHMAGVDHAAAASGTRVEAQAIQYGCLVQTFKSRVGDDIARTLVVPGAKLQTISLNYTVQGDATEEFTFQGNTRTWLRYDAVLVSGAVTGGALTYSGARVLRDGSYVMAIFDAAGYLPLETAVTQSASQITVNTTDIPNTTPLWAVIHRDESNLWDYTWETMPSGMATGMRGWGVEVFLVKSGSANSRVYRGQSITLQAQFPSQRIQELGSEVIVGYSDTVPEVTGTLEIMQHDFALLEQLSGDDTSAQDNWGPNELTGGGWGVEIRLWPRGVNRSTTQPVKTVWVPEIELTQDSAGSQVNQDAMMTFNWASKSGDVYFYKGAR